MSNLKAQYRKVLLVLSGTVVAQLIPIAFAPFLTRLYSPRDFGAYALFTSVVTFGATIASLRYELSITLPKDHRDALALLKLSVLLSAGTAVLSIPFIVLNRESLASILGTQTVTLESWIWLLPAALLLTGISNAIRYWLIRTKQFRTIAINSIQRALITSIAALVGGCIGPTREGLIGGFLLGLAISTATVTAKVFLAEKVAFLRISYPELKKIALEQRKFPQYSSFSSLVESAAGQLPTVFFTAAAGPAALGLFSLAQRIANLPLSVVASSVGDVFRQEASEAYSQSRECKQLFDSVLLKLAILSLPVFIFAILCAPSAFEIVFGATWRESGVYVQILAPALALRLISSPLSTMFYIAQKQSADMIIQIGLLMTLLIALNFSVNTDYQFEGRYAVAAYSALYSIKYIIELVLARRFASGI